MPLSAGFAFPSAESAPSHAPVSAGPRHTSPALLRTFYASSSSSKLRKLRVLGSQVVLRSQPEAHGQVFRSLRLRQRQLRQPASTSTSTSPASSSSVGIPLLAGLRRLATADKVAPDAKLIRVLRLDSHGILKVLQQVRNAKKQKRSSQRRRQSCLAIHASLSLSLHTAMLSLCFPSHDLPFPEPILLLLLLRCSHRCSSAKLSWPPSPSRTHTYLLTSLRGKGNDTTQTHTYPHAPVSTRVSD